MGGCRNILVIDDSDDDYLLLSRAFSQIGKKVQLRRIKTAAEARLMMFDNESPPPSIILLDYNCPTSAAALDFVRWARVQPTWRKIPIIVNTGAISPNERNAAYEAGVSSCIRKPESFDGLVEQMQQVLSYWCGMVELPVFM